MNEQNDLQKSPFARLQNAQVNKGLKPYKICTPYCNYLLAKMILAAIYFIQSVSCCSIKHHHQFFHFLLQFRFALILYFCEANQENYLASCIASLKTRPPLYVFLFPEELYDFESCFLFYARKNPRLAAVFPFINFLLSTETVFRARPWKGRVGRLFLLKVRVNNLVCMVKFRVNFERLFFSNSIYNYNYLISRLKAISQDVLDFVGHATHLAHLLVTHKHLLHDYLKFS